MSLFKCKYFTIARIQYFCENNENASLHSTQNLLKFPLNSINRYYINNTDNGNEKGLLTWE